LPNGSFHFAVNVISGDSLRMNQHQGYNPVVATWKIVEAYFRLLI